MTSDFFFHHWKRDSPFNWETSLDLNNYQPRDEHNSTTVHYKKGLKQVLQIGVTKKSRNQQKDDVGLITVVS